MPRQRQDIGDLRQRLLGRPLWVFGYGSLMWNPGFAHRATCPARIYGYHRDFAMRSVRHRGTPQTPGLVLTLCPGGSCLGRAFQVAAADVPAAYDYLMDREIGTYAYGPALVPCRTTDETVRALTFVPTPSAPQFVPGLSMHEQAAIMAQATGGMGTNRAYLAHTIDQMQALGLSTQRFRALAALIDAIN